MSTLLRLCCYELWRIRTQVREYMTLASYSTIKLMLNIKPSSKSRPKRADKPTQPEPLSRTPLDSRIEDQPNSKKVFKKLSMSFYNWTTKNKQKQVVCENFSLADQSCKSVGSVSCNNSPAKKPKSKPVKQRPSSQPRVGKQPLFEQFCFNKRGGKQIFNMKKTPEYSEYLHFQSTPMEVSHFYYRHYNQEKSPEGRARVNSKGGVLGKPSSTMKILKRKVGAMINGCVTNSRPSSSTRRRQ